MIFAIRQQRRLCFLVGSQALIVFATMQTNAQQPKPHNQVPAAAATVVKPDNQVPGGAATVVKPDNQVPPAATTVAEPHGADALTQHLHELPPPGLYLTIDAISPQHLVQNGPADVTYTLWNNTKNAEHGQLSGTILERRLTLLPAVGSVAPNLEPGARQQGHLTIKALPVSGTGSIRLIYIGANGLRKNTHLRRIVSQQLRGRFIRPGF